jgi:glycogen operon protein
VTWLTPTAEEMTPEHWQNPNARCMGILLDGRAQPTGIRKRGTDVTLLLLLNAHDDVVKCKLPEVVGGKGWMCLIDTNQPDLDPPGQSEFGAEYPVAARSLVLFQLRPERRHKG